MQGKVVVITGGTSGIGEIAAEKLAAMGARIVLVARDRERGEAVLKRLRELGPGVAHGVHYADLSSLAEMKRVTAEIAAAEPRVDILINNAGAMFSKRHVTKDGFELTFALNHLAYFVVTLGLLDRLKASGAARIVSTASTGHKVAKLDFDDLQSLKSYSAMQSYGRSKLYNILFTRELARRLAGTGVTANCLHPGFVASRFGNQSGGVLQSLFGVAKLFAITPEKGAETIIYLASSPEVANVSGGYFYRCRQVRPSAQAQSDAAAQRLWAETEKLTGVAG